MLCCVVVVVVLVVVVVVMAVVPVWCVMWCGVVWWELSTFDLFHVLSFSVFFMSFSLFRLVDFSVDVYQCDDTIFFSRFEPEDCMRTFSQSEPTRLLSSLQGASLSQQHRLRCHRIQGPYRQYPQVPTVSLVPCPTLLNIVPTHFTHDETQRVATKPDFRQHPTRR